MAYFCQGANILVDNKECIKLADFGASKKVVELLSFKLGIASPLIYGVLDVLLLRWLQESLLGASSIRREPNLSIHLLLESVRKPILRSSQEVSHIGGQAIVMTTCFQIDDEDDLVIGATTKFDSALLSDDFNKSFNPMFEPDDNWPCKSDDTLEKLPGSVPHWGSCNCDDDMCKIDDKDDLVIGASTKFDYALLSDDFNKSFNPMSEPDDNWPCKSDDTTEKLPGSVLHWGSGNCDDDMCQIDDEDDLVIGASSKFDSALLSDDFNKPEDNWPCKSNDTPELESKVNLFSGQTVNKAADIPRASESDDDDDFHQTGQFEKSLNATLIALIPKKGGAEDIWDFRPIMSLRVIPVAVARRIENASFYERKRIWEEELEDKELDFYNHFNIIVLGLDSIEARSYINAVACGFLEYDSDDNPREETVKPMVDGAAEGFKGHARVIVPGVTPCFECTIWLFPPQVKFPLCTLAKTPRTATHCIEYAHLIKWDEVHSGKTFDPDIPEHMQWVYSEAVKRAELFSIPGVTYFLTQGVVNTIIPAIASTNAIISAACALETLKIASGFSKTLSNYLT
ncbi:unnamed protein product [Camellia sinensis]